MRLSFMGLSTPSRTAGRGAVTHGCGAGSPEGRHSLLDEDGWVNVWAWRGGEAGPASPAGLEVMYEDETFWLSQRRMAELFGVDDRTVSEHLGNIYASGELAEQATHRKFRRVRREGSREVSRAVAFYNLDAIISVGTASTAARLPNSASGPPARCVSIRSRVSWRTSTQPLCPSNTSLSAAAHSLATPFSPLHAPPTRPPLKAV